MEVAVHVERGDGLYPCLPAAGRIVGAGRPGLGHVPVVAAHVAVDELPDLGFGTEGRRLRDQPLDRAGVLESLEVQVTGEAVARDAQAGVGGCVGAEVAGAFGADGEVGVRQDAQVVRRRRVAVAVAESPPVAGPDVRDSVFGVPDHDGPAVAGRPVGWCRRGRRGGGTRQRDPGQ
ncbi:hypothetical protein GCM10015536_67760 [Streptomyces griseomycini]|nr:hypothetical protein GCM10015536_67760 [Streptomyces griseomycini]